MRIRTIMLAAALVLPVAIAMPAAAKSKAKANKCPPVTAFHSDMKIIKGYRVFTGPDGDSAIEPMDIKAKEVPLLTTGKILGMFELPTAPKRGVQIVAGPADLDLPLHPAPYKEMFVTLAGSVTMKAKSFQVELVPGTMVLFEDVDAKVGHGGRTGPCGYVSLSIAP